ncbi:hypothetical protein CBM2637_B20031 [Cupriavidus taiwanensis]|nr:hypothetical protein CBM2637_B20031 [Cupriavidus taiwanensis]
MKHAAGGAAAAAHVGRATLPASRDAGGMGKSAPRPSRGHHRPAGTLHAQRSESGTMPGCALALRRTRTRPLSRKRLSVYPR